MAMIVPLTTTPDLAELSNHLSDNLPDYARPVFLRIGSEIEKTSTFKQRKQGSSEDGFNPAKTTDRLYFADALTGKFHRLDSHAYDRICMGEIRL